MNRRTQQRVQTASPHNRLHNKHQDTILKEIKAVQVLQQLDMHTRSTHTHKPAHSSARVISKPKLKHYSSDLEQELAVIERIRGKEPKPKFSFSKDQKKICRDGWAEFGEKVERKTHAQLQNIRKRANHLLSRATVPNICIINGVTSVDQSGHSVVAEQKINTILQVVHGGDEVDRKYFKLSDLNRQIKSSVVLRNAYKLCLHSKNYKSATEQDLVDQKFKSFVYVNENAKKLTKKKREAIMSNNFLLE